MNETFENKALYSNQLKQTTLDSLLHIATKSQLNGLTNGDFNHFVNELKWLNPNMRLNCDGVDFVYNFVCKGFAVQTLL